MNKAIESVCVLGLGYVGLSTAAVLAEHGVQVIGVDLDPKRVATVNAGTCPIDEPGLDLAVARAVKSGMLTAKDYPVAADAFIVAVPTPLGKEHAPDLSHVHAAVRSLAPVLQPGNLVLLESTCPVGTTEAVCRWMAQERPEISFPHAAGEGSDIRVAYCPERVLPGRILEELATNHRVIGGVTPACASAAEELYRIFFQGSCSLTSAATAELVKLAENAYRDLNIAFANEISLVCDALEIDPWQVIDLANRHPRVDILQPGPGVGGHCIPIDPWFIVHSAPEVTPLIRAARRVNDGRPGWVTDQALEACTGLEDPIIACLGLAYKADSNDLRESPSIAVIQQLQAFFDGTLLVVEPHVEGLPSGVSGQEGAELVDLETALGRAQVIVLLTDHQEFRRIPPEALAGKRVIDTRGIWREA